MITTLKKIPLHYRRLGDDELVRRTDLAIPFGHPINGIEQVGKHFVKGLTPDNNPSWVYYRRRHVRVQAAMKVIVSEFNGEKKPHPVEKNPIVSFSYPHKDKAWYATPQRFVRLIAANEKYIIGLDINDGNKFKKFLRLKAGRMDVIEFNPEAVK